RLRISAIQSDPLRSVAKQAFTQPPRYFSGLSAPIYAISPPAPKSDFPFFLIQQIVMPQHVRQQGAYRAGHVQNGWFLHHQTNAESVGVRTEDGVGRGNGKDSCLGG